jgi:pSer/pThr/pTyr-binding forkhead associated (FHA) protein
VTVRLSVVGGPARGSDIVVAGEELIIGRESPIIGGRLGDDDALSRRHASVCALDDGRVLIEDLGSRNGTFVNDQQIHGRHVCEAGDLVRVGTSVLEIVEMSDDTVATGSRPAASAAHGGVVIGGGLRADRGGVAAGRDIHGDVQTVRADHGGSAAGRDIVHQEHYNLDASGLGLITQTSGFPKVLIVVGVIVALAGFASFAYPIVRAVTEGFNNTDPSSPPTFHVMPWLPLGFGLMFAGIVLSTIGTLSIRQRRD